MVEVLEIDGSYGEGGGQVLRTALTLATLTGQPTRIHKIRAARRNPGLAPQHLTGLLALARVCSADLRGAYTGSTEVQFYPRSRPRPDEYVFDVRDAAKGRSAGSVPLIFQTLIFPLALSGSRCRLTLKGGTNVPWSPPFEYLVHVYLHMLGRMGVKAECRLRTRGFYPVGGGEMVADIHGLKGSSALADSVERRTEQRGQTEGVGIARDLIPLVLTARGDLIRIWGDAVTCNLPGHIAKRMATHARCVLADAGLESEVRPREEKGPGPGAGLFLTVAYDHSVAGFSALGKRGKPSEEVAEEACRDLIAFHGSRAPVDMHLADQLLLPMALSRGQSEFWTCRVTRHLATNAHIIGQFLPTRIEIQGGEGKPGRVRVLK